MLPGTLFVGRKRIGKHANDADVRALLKEYLGAIHDGTGTVVLEELGLCQGDVRVDVAAVNGELSAFEIKSPSDTLARWPKQRKIYSKVADRAWLIASMKTLDKAELPSWWGRVRSWSTCAMNTPVSVRRCTGHCVNVRGGGSWVT